MNVREKISAYMEKYGITLCEISALSNIKRHKLENIFAYKRDMSVKEYVAICKSLSVDISYFL